jgi:hypothetical protein
VPESCKELRYKSYICSPKLKSRLAPRIMARKLERRSKVIMKRRKLLRQKRTNNAPAVGVKASLQDQNRDLLSSVLLRLKQA